MNYGQKPVIIYTILAEVNELMYYQYLPIKMPGTWEYIPDQLHWFKDIIHCAKKNFIQTFGEAQYHLNYMYITAKVLYVKPNSTFNRPGWHSDGFLTTDINYIWCDSFPTIFNVGRFNLTADHNTALTEMEIQARENYNIIYPTNTLLRLNQYCIHKVAEVDKIQKRAFLKISFSDKKYNLLGNSHNYLLDYNWEMHPRQNERNHPNN